MTWYEGWTLIVWFYPNLPGQVELERDLVRRNLVEPI